MTDLNNNIASRDLQMNALQHERLIQLATELALAPAMARRDVVVSAAAELGRSVATVYRWLGTHGAAHTPISRKRRCDAGQCDVTGDELRTLAAMLVATFRKTGNRIMTFEAACEVARHEGLLQSGLSASRLAVLLRREGLHPDQIMAPSAAIEQRSLHPNHVWQVDASVCVAYYLSNATGLQVMDEKKFYKNKPNNLTRVQQERLIRYAVADHYSHNLMVRYYLGSECAASLTDFLIWAFSQKPKHIMHGVPNRIQMDMGSANTSAPTLNMLKRLDVVVDIHARHNSRANGSVEKAHHIWERGFESALSFTHVDDLADMNDKAELWAHGFCASRKHTRYNAPRYAKWQEITQQQLRIAPPLDVLRELPTLAPVQRTVSSNLTISFAFGGSMREHGQADFDVRFVPGIKPKDKLDVVVNVFAAPAVDVAFTDTETGEIKWMTLQPQERGADGRLLSAPVIGEEMRTAPRTVVDTNRDALTVLTYGTPADVATAKEAKAAGAVGIDVLALAKKRQEAGGLAFGGAVDAFAPARTVSAGLPAFLPKRGEVLELPAIVQREIVGTRVSVVQACAAAKARLGSAYQPTLFTQWQAEFGTDGVPESVLDAVVDVALAQAVAQAQPAPTVPKLYAVGGA